jgi:hypothetical protein
MTRRPAEATEIHTRILRCMLAADDCYAYWQRVDVRVPVEQRAARAFEQRWFGVKSEARVRTLIPNMVERFDAFPEALALLQSLGSVPAALRPFICHLHLQLSDPIYRRFAGEYLPERRAQGYSAVDRTIAANWVEGIAPERWSAITSLKFASNMLSAAAEAGVLKGRKDPRKLTIAPVPDAAVGYALYLLRTVEFAGTLSDNPYLRSIGIDAGLFPLAMARVPGIGYRMLGGVHEVDWRYPSLTAWGTENLRASA